jgi:hypothetical protein
MEERLKVFTAEIESQWEEMLKLHSSIKNKSASLKSDRNNEDLINSLAYKLHNLYSAYEDIFKLIARFFENQIEDITRYHIGLISRMRIAIEGIRPKLLSEDSYRILDELRGFRHIFRHAYTYELDAERIIRLSEKAEKLGDIFAKDFEKFKEEIIKG